MIGAWVLSLAWARNQWVHPFASSVGFVAEPVTNGMPALSQVGPAAADSPEKFGPRMPTNDWSLATLMASGGITVGSPCVSSGTAVIVTGRFPYFPALASATTICVACHPGTTRPAAGPVSAPKKASLTAVFPPVDPLLLLLHPAATSANTATAASTRSVPFRCNVPLLSSVALFAGWV